MRTETTTRTLYNFDELSDEAQRKAIDNLCDINVDYEWWEGTYEDAKNIGCKIRGFDIGRPNEIDFKCDYPEDTAQKIVADHGAEFLADVANLSREEDESFSDEYEFEALADDFRKSLGEEYLSMLRKEYEYFTSEEAIRETIDANGYEFTADGKPA